MPHVVFVKNEPRIREMYHYFQTKIEGDVCAEKLADFLKNDLSVETTELSLYCPCDFRALADLGVVLGKVVELNLAWNQYISSLAGISDLFPEIRTVMAAHATNITTVEPLSQCLFLTSLTIDHSSVNDLHGLEFCQALSRVSCKNTRVRQVDWLFSHLPDIVIEMGGVYAEQPPRY